MVTTPIPDLTVDLAIFAYNEADGIGGVLRGLGGQDVFAQPGLDLRVLVLANGCSDDTVAQAEAARADMPDDVARRIEVMDLAQGGKSRTTHQFIHVLSRASAEILCFMDADIDLPQPDTVRRLIMGLQSRPELQAFTSRPIKDVAHYQLKVGPVAKLISAGGDGLTDWRRSICGQLFALRRDMARSIGVPTGLPVEDGFIRAMVVTDVFSTPENLDRIDGDPEVFHVYESIRGLGELIHHQARIVLGSAVNAVIYAHLREARDRGEDTSALLMQAAQDDNWLADLLRTTLPRAPYGYVPFRFMTKRFKVAHQRGWPLGPKGKGLIMLVVGGVLDAIVWLRATIQMWRGAGSGHW